MNSKWTFRNLQSDYQNLIPFVPANDGKEDVESSKKEASEDCHVSGTEIKEYYENLINDDSKKIQKLSQNIVEKYKSRKTCRSSERDRKRSKSEIKTRPATEDGAANDDNNRLINRKNSEMLKYSQNGDLIGLRKAVEDGANVNYQDGFGWSALMCGAVAGHGKVVEFLLEKEADANLQNNLKQTVRDMAEQARLFKVVGILDEHKHYFKRKIKVEPETRAKVYCEICKVDVSDRRKHETSTAHLFNRQIKPTEPSFMIPESNRGFQMMLKHGWDKGRGLGSEGQGQKYPVKTVLKRDRHGLGAVAKQKSKVTHFNAKDLQAVQRVRKNVERHVTSRTLSKWEMRRRERKDKNWERDMRHYFNT
ncbi:G patch domain and ankyrin repeat-containing protein 1 [Patella vulgata]|uniref:G patch domain and ankyrin repeat-containing protein 1 n=1 Tax=Patella vulgata TaxID=6465 RepID=UPI00217FE969|nr:G patch domain and ankyrin repeat-containing protein 1 [Patella vulgata]